MKIKPFAAGLLLGAAILTGCARQTPPTVQTSEIPGTPESSAPPESVTLPPVSGEETAPPKEIFRESGSAASNISKTITLQADWEAVSYDGKTAEVIVKVNLICWEIEVGKRDGQYAGNITVNGQTESFSTPPIKHTIKEQKKFRFAQTTFIVPLNEDAPTELSIVVTWPFNGRYSGQRIGVLKDSTAAVLPGGSREVSPEDAVPQQGS